jgi:hypothetical protein
MTSAPSLEFTWLKIRHPVVDTWGSGGFSYPKCNLIQFMKVVIDVTEHGF